MFAGPGIDADLPEVAVLALLPFAVAVGVDARLEHGDAAEADGGFAAPTIALGEFLKGGAAATVGDGTFDAHRD